MGFQNIMLFFNFGQKQRNRVPELGRLWRWNVNILEYHSPSNVRWQCKVQSRERPLDRKLQICSAELLLFQRPEVVIFDAKLNQIGGIYKLLANICYSP